MELCKLHQAGLEYNAYFRLNIRLLPTIVISPAGMIQPAVQDMWGIPHQEPEPGESGRANLRKRSVIQVIY